MTLKITVTWDMMAYSLVYIYQGLEGTYCFHFKVKIILHLSMCQASRHVGIGGIVVLTLISALKKMSGLEDDPTSLSLEKRGG
jgi:hypothetical protein